MDKDHLVFLRCNSFHHSRLLLRYISICLRLKQRRVSGLNSKVLPGTLLCSLTYAHPFVLFISLVLGNTDLQQTLLEFKIWNQERATKEMFKRRESF